MATTTNYGWTTPDDTALVKDGAAAIRTLGSSVDTTTKNLNPSTTLGDIEYRSSTANTNTRLGIGTTGQILAVSGGVPAWTTPVSGGGMTLINTGGTTLTGASVTIGSIPSGYINLQLIVENFLPANDNNTLSVRVNNDSNANRHKINTLIQQENVSFDATAWDLTGGGDNAVSETIIKLDIYGYANTTTWKMAQSNFLQNYHGGSSNMNIGIRQLGYNQTAAITSLVLFPGSGNFTSGTAYLYGVK
jgi:hypothetical protein